MNQIQSRRVKNRSRSKSNSVSNSRRFHVKIGKKIQVRDTDDEEWRIALVTSKKPVLARLEGCGKSHEWNQIKKYEKRQSTSRTTSLDEHKNDNTRLSSGRRRRSKHRLVSCNSNLNEDPPLPKKKRSSSTQKNNERKQSTSSRRKKQSKSRSKSRSRELSDDIQVKVSKTKKTFDKQNTNKKVKETKFENLNLAHIDRPITKTSSVPVPPTKKPQRIIANNYIVGDRVKMRDENYSSWNSGVITCVKPLRARFSTDKPSCEGYEWDQIKLTGRKPRKVTFVYDDMVKIIPNRDMIKAILVNS